MAFRIRRKQNVNAMRVGIKVGMTVLALYVGGFFLTEIGKVMLNTSSPFYKGLTLIGWTVGAPATDAAGYYFTCASPAVNSSLTTAPTTNCLTSVNGSGILAIVGIVAIAMLIFEFVDISY